MIISESEGFMNAAAVISENLFQSKHGVIDSKSSVLTDMMLALIGKTNGDTMEKDDFNRLFLTFSEFQTLFSHQNYVLSRYNYEEAH